MLAFMLTLIATTVYQPLPQWFVWTAPANGQAQITSLAVGIDTQVSVATGRRPRSTLPAMMTNAGGCGGCASDTEFFPVTGGTDYYIQWNDDGFGFSWDLNFLLPPSPQWRSGLCERGCP